MSWWRDPVVVTAIFTAVIAVSTVAYTIITRRLWKATKQSVDASRKSVEIAEKTFEASHRPYLGIEHISRKTPPQDPHWWIVVTVQNFGNLPASNVKAEAQVEIDNKPVGKNFVSDPLEVFPKTPNRMTLENTLTPEMARKVNAGEAVLTINVSIAYSIPPNVRYEHLALVKYNAGAREFRVQNSSTERV